MTVAIVTLSGITPDDRQKIHAALAAAAAREIEHISLLHQAIDAYHRSSTYPTHRATADRAECEASLCRKATSALRRQSRLAELMASVIAAAEQATDNSSPTWEGLQGLRDAVDAVRKERRQVCA